jgi:hypothetical protein
MEKAIRSKNHSIVIEEKTDSLVVKVDGESFAVIADLSLPELDSTLLKQYVETTYSIWSNSSKILKLDKFDFMVDGSTCSDSR